jgi:hypothetical protein
MQSLVSFTVGSFILRLPSSSGSIPTPSHGKRITLNVEILRDKGISVGEVLIVRSSIQTQDNQWQKVHFNPSTTPHDGS